MCTGSDQRCRPAPAAVVDLADNESSDVCICSLNKLLLLPFPLASIFFFFPLPTLPFSCLIFFLSLSLPFLFPFPFLLPLSSLFSLSISFPCLPSTAIPFPFPFFLFHTLTPLPSRFSPIFFTGRTLCVESGMLLVLQRFCNAQMFCCQCCRCYCSLLLL